MFCTALCPGFTFSEFHDIMGTRGAVSKLPRFLWMDAATVAQEGYNAVMEGKPVFINGLINQGMSQLLSHIPLSAKQFLARKQTLFN